MEARKKRRAVDRRPVVSHPRTRQVPLERKHDVDDAAWQHVLAPMRVGDMNLPDPVDEGTKRMARWRRVMDGVQDRTIIADAVARRGGARTVRATAPGSRTSPCTISAFRSCSRRGTASRTP